MPPLLRNLGRSGKYVLSEDFSVNPLPRVARIEPSSVCNLNCVHCPTNKDSSARTGIMTRQTFDRIVKQLEKCRIDTAVLYHGGEPLLNTHFFYMVFRLKKAGVARIKTVTNGTLLDESLTAHLADSGIDEIEFSLDGQSPEENDSIRRGCRFWDVVSNIKRFLETREGLSVCIASTIVPRKEEILQDSLPIPPSYIQEVFKGYPVKYKVTYMIKWPGYRLKPDETIVRVNGKGNIPRYCHNLLETTTIRWNGDVVPCCQDITGMHVLGSILDKDIDMIWNNSATRNLRESIYRRKLTPLCSHCHVVVPGTFVAKT